MKVGTRFIITAIKILKMVTRIEAIEVFEGSISKKIFALEKKEKHSVSFIFCVELESVP